MFCMSRKNQYCSHLFHISLLHLTKSVMANKQEKMEHHLLFTLTICAGTCSILAAGVPGLGQNWLMKRLGNWQSFTKSNVSWKSSSVSPGKPQIMSVAMVTPGTLKERDRQHFSTYLVFLVYNHCEILELGSFKNQYYLICNFLYFRKVEAIIIISKLHFLLETPAFIIWHLASFILDVSDRV